MIGPALTGGEFGDPSDSSSSISISVSRLISRGEGLRSVARLGAYEAGDAGMLTAAC